MRLKAAAKREVRATAGPEGIHISDTLAEGELVRRAEEHLEVPATPIDDEDGEAPSLDFFPYDTETLDARHTDDRLQTTSTPEQLDKSLRRIDEQARATLDEQGVNALFLALGMLHYTESADSDELFKAPLVLVPVELMRQLARSGYGHRATDDDPLVNPALTEYLHREFGIALPDLPDTNTIPDD